MTFQIANAVSKALNGEAVALEVLFSQHCEDVSKRTALIGEIDICAIVKHESREQWQMILEDVSGGGRWRTQGFDRNGFSGHVIFSSKDKAIWHAAENGFYARDDGALDEIQDTPSFQSGMYAIEQLDLLNSGQITVQEYGNRMVAHHGSKSLVSH